MKPVKEWKEADLDELHTGQIMESASLEYKDSRALSNTIHHKKEMFKDVSAFANAGGGILIYGMREHDHLPIGTDDGVDPTVIRREWIENILSTNIEPPVEGLVVQPIILASRGPATLLMCLTSRPRNHALRTKGRSTNTTGVATLALSRWKIAKCATSCGEASNRRARLLHRRPPVVSLRL